MKMLRIIYHRLEAQLHNTMDLCLVEWVLILFFFNSVCNMTLSLRLQFQFIMNFHFIY